MALYTMGMVDWVGLEKVNNDYYSSTHAAVQCEMHNNIRSSHCSWAMETTNPDIDERIFESYFRDRLTFSNIRSRTSRRIYRLALPLSAPETLSSLSKSRISIFNAHLTLFVRRMQTSHNSIGSTDI